MNIFLIVTSIVVGVLISMPQTASAQKNIKIGLALPKEKIGADFINGMYERFGSEVEVRTNGALTVQIVYGGALGDPDARLNQMQNGAIQMTDAADGNYVPVYPEIGVLSIPYLFATEQIAHKVLDGPFGHKLAEGLRIRTGIRVLGWWDSGGFKHFSSNRPLRSPSDFAGLKMRELGPLALPLIEALKASAVPIRFGNLYTALSTGLVDVQDNSLSIFRLLKLQDVHKIILLSGHTYALGVFGMNNASYIALSKDDRAAVDAAASKAIAFNRESSHKAEQEALPALRAAGVEFIELTPEQKEQFRTTIQDSMIYWLRTRINVPSFVDEVLLAAQDAR